MNDMSIKEFNQKVLSMMMEIKNSGVKKEKIIDDKKCKIHKLYWKDDVNTGEPSERYLDYYLIEFEYSGTMYKISMFYKDFDMRTGNVHVLPGAIQIWRKVKCNCEYMCDELIHTNMDLIRPYIEYGWSPMCYKPILWNMDNEVHTKLIGEIYSKIRTGCYDKPVESEKVCLEGAKEEQYIYSSSFYAPIIGNFNKPLPSSEERTMCGHYMKYSLLRWKDEKDKDGNKYMYTLYKIYICQGYGIFAKYGKEGKYLLNNENQPNTFEDNEWKFCYKSVETSVFDVIRI